MAICQKNNKAAMKSSGSGVKVLIGKVLQSTPDDAIAQLLSKLCYSQIRKKKKCTAESLRGLGINLYRIVKIRD